MSIFSFSRYCDETDCKANSASGGLNKWLHQYVPDNCVIHSFRHSLCDQLRGVECPSDIANVIGGWKTSGVGHGYGNGYPLKALEKWMERITHELFKPDDKSLTFGSQPSEPCLFE